MAGSNALISREDPDTLFVLTEQVGAGAFGAVFKGVHLQTGKYVAIKILESPDLKSESLDALLNEARILTSTAHANIVSALGVWQKGKELYIALEFCDGGSLYDIMHYFGRPFSESVAVSIMFFVLQALEYLHAKGVIHRDIKSENIMLTSAGTVKLVDFGISKATTTLDPARTFIGTPYWLAPEVITGKSGSEPYSSKADIWAAGITTYELVAARPPLKDEHPLKAILDIPRRPPPTLPEKCHWSVEFRSFFSACMVKQPESRPSASDLLEHPVFSRHNHAVELQRTAHQWASKSSHLDTLDSLKKDLQSPEPPPDPRPGSPRLLQATCPTTHTTHSVPPRTHRRHLSHTSIDATSGCTKPSLQEPARVYLRPDKGTHSEGYSTPGSGTNSDWYLRPDPGTNGAVTDQQSTVRTPKRPGRSRSVLDIPIPDMPVLKDTTVKSAISRPRSAQFRQDALKMAETSEPSAALKKSPLVQRHGLYDCPSGFRQRHPAFSIPVILENTALGGSGLESQAGSLTFRPDKKSRSLRRYEVEHLATVFDLLIDAHFLTKMSTRLRPLEKKHQEELLELEITDLSVLASVPFHVNKADRLAPCGASIIRETWAAKLSDWMAVPPHSLPVLSQFVQTLTICLEAAGRGVAGGLDRIQLKNLKEAFLCSGDTSARLARLQDEWATVYGLVEEFLGGEEWSERQRELSRHTRQNDERHGVLKLHMARVHNMQLRHLEERQAAEREYLRGEVAEGEAKVRSILAAQKKERSKTLKLELAALKKQLSPGQTWAHIKAERQAEFEQSESAILAQQESRTASVRETLNQHLAEMQRNDAAGLLEHQASERKAMEKRVLVERESMAQMVTSQRRAHVVDGLEVAIETLAEHQRARGDMVTSLAQAAQAECALFLVALREVAMRSELMLEYCQNMKCIVEVAMRTCEQRAADFRIAQLPERNRLYRYLVRLKDEAQRVDENALDLDLLVLPPVKMISQDEDEDEAPHFSGIIPHIPPPQEVTKQSAQTTAGMKVQEPSKMSSREVIDFKNLF